MPKANTVAACASAIAAAASAIAAIFALYYASKQEQIATTQVEATYLGNLYSRQTIVFGELFATVLNFRTQFILPDDEIASPDYKGDPSAARRALHERKAAYLERRYAVLSGYVAASLISPKELQEPLKRILDDVTDIRKQIQNYANLDNPSQNDLVEFQKNFPALQKNID